ILELVRYNLQKEGFAVTGFTNGEDGVGHAQQEPPNLVVLDLMLPGIDGLEVCRILKSRKATSDIPIIMISAKGEESEIVSGLELGADDYITKPFSPKILIARTKAVLRRLTERPADDRATLNVHGISIDPVRFEVRAGGEQIPLTVTEFRIL